MQENEEKEEGGSHDVSLNKHQRLKGEQDHDIALYALASVTTNTLYMYGLPLVVHCTNRHQLGLTHLGINEMIYVCAIQKVEHITI